MPLFEYQCLECHHRFEAFVVGSRTPEQCPKCRSARIEKQYSTFGLGGGERASGGWGPSCSPSGGG